MRQACAFCIRMSLTKKWYRGEVFRVETLLYVGNVRVIVCIVNPGN